MLSSLVILLATASAGAPQDRRAEDPRAAFALLSPQERRDVADFLESELARVRTFQLDLARHVVATQDRDPKAWPEATDAPWFDPERHAPAQPIPRRRLAADDPRVATARKSLSVALDPRGWIYDYASGSVLHHAEQDTPERVFELALRGLPPNADLVQALVERTLDDGSERKSHAAFAHAYTDRSGNAYTGITLYDAWRSGDEIEMPDVDCLGIVNTVLDDWTTWTSIVPGDRQASLYARIADLFQPAHRQRELRAAIAATYLEAAPELCCGYGGSIDNFHALWEVSESTPTKLGARLPNAAGWKEFLGGWVAECTRDGAMYQRGVARGATLAAEGETVRAVLHGVLDEYGAFARLRGATGAKAERLHGDR